ncbi:MAG TPA: hypothetical protein VNC11_09890 [Gemmatimonadaceae bacterium]|jgi:hypothetical protein|nr:hypothetical protein [Gemmatimonadaceae bacterium]
MIVPPRTRWIVAVCAAFLTGAVPARAQTRLYYEQTYMPASHNWAFRSAYSKSDRLFNAFDYGHAVLYETLWRHPSAPVERLDQREFDFITKKLLVDPPRVTLDESAIAPEYSKLAPEVVEMFEWAHMLHRQIYDVLADERIADRDRDARVAEVLKYYRSRPALAFSSHPKDMELMEGQSYSLAFRKKFPKYNGLIWSYHWLQMTLYDALLAGDNPRERHANVAMVTDRFWEMLRGGQKALPAMMPMSPAIATRFSSRFPEAAIIFDNLHSLHDVVSDILANPSVPRDRKRAEILAAAARYRDDTSNVMTADAWRSMALEMGVENMGGLPPLRRSQ